MLSKFPEDRVEIVQDLYLRFVGFIVIHDFLSSSMKQTSGTERHDGAEKATRRSLVLQLSIMVKSQPDKPGCAFAARSENSPARSGTSSARSISRRSVGGLLARATL
jgi:hypothetical protein